MSSILSRRRRWLFLAVVLAALSITAVAVAVPDSRSGDADYFIRGVSESARDVIYEVEFHFRVPEGSSDVGVPWSECIADGQAKELQKGGFNPSSSVPWIDPTRAKALENGTYVTRSIGWREAKPVDFEGVVVPHLDERWEFWTSTILPLIEFGCSKYGFEGAVTP